MAHVDGECRENDTWSQHRHAKHRVGFFLQWIGTSAATTSGPEQGDGEKGREGERALSRRSRIRRRRGEEEKRMAEGGGGEGEGKRKRKKREKERESEGEGTEGGDGARSYLYCAASV
jgi:hypothetical protein